MNTITRSMIKAVIFISAFCMLISCGRRSSRISITSAIQNSGSDTMVNLAQAWAEAYAGVDSTVSIEVSGGGSGTGIAALINGTVDVANTSREMEPEEKAGVIENTGLEAEEFMVAFDALAVYVHKNNPIDQITISQLAEIYGEGGKIDRWSALGINNTLCENDKLIRVSRQSNSGTYFYFREAILGEDHDFKLGSRDLHGSKDVVELIGSTPCAIGYSGLGYATDHVKKLRIGKTADGPFYEPAIETVLNGTYPIARPLYMYSLGAPDQHIRAYMEWILSEQGQKILIDNGYVPLPEEQRQNTLAHLRENQ